MTGSSTPLAPAAFSYPGHGGNAGIGVAICHGFTGSPLSVLPWAEHLAGQGFAVSVPLLPGHGTDWRDLARHGWQDWYRAFEAAYLELAAGTRHCYVAGLSMGGTIALRTAARHRVAGVAVVNPGLSFYDRRVRLHRPAEVLPAHHGAGPGSRTRRASATEDGDYSLTPLAAVHQLSRLFKAALRGLPAVTAPALVFKSATDIVVPPSSLALLRQAAGVAGRLTWSRCRTAATWPRSTSTPPLIFEQSVRFFLQHAPPPRPRHAVQPATRAPETP